jgi:hypothetical protein
VRHPKLWLLSIMVVAASALVFSVLLMVGCGPGRSGPGRNGVPSNAKGTFLLAYTFKPQLEGVSQLKQFTLVWTVTQFDGPLGVPTLPQIDIRDPAAKWTSTFVTVPNLDPGPYNLSVSVTVDGNSVIRACPGSTTLPAGPPFQVFLTFDESANSVYCN